MKNIKESLKDTEDRKMLNMLIIIPERIKQIIAEKLPKLMRNMSAHIQEA